MPEINRGKEALVVGKAQPRSTREKSGQHPDLFGTFLVRYCEMLIAAAHNKFSIVMIIIFLIVNSKNNYCFYCFYCVLILL